MTTPTPTDALTQLRDALPADPAHDDDHWAAVRVVVGAAEAHAKLGEAWQEFFNATTGYVVLPSEPPECPHGVCQAQQLPDGSTLLTCAHCGHQETEQLKAAQAAQ